MRLIDKDALITKFDLECWGECCCCKHNDKGNCRILLDAPTIEAEPIKYGKWLDRESAPWGQVYETCSICLQRQTLDEGLDHFCPLCGAKMNSYKRKMDGRG